MNPYHEALLLGAIIAGLLSSGPADRRGVLWIAAGAMSFVASVLLWNAAGDVEPWPAFFSALLDASVAACLIGLRRQKWETLVAWIFTGMVLVNFAYLLQLIGPHSAYVLVLELLNWAALAIIGGRPIIRWVGNVLDHGGHRLGSFDGAVRAVDRHREAPGFIYRKK